VIEVITGSSAWRTKSPSPVRDAVIVTVPETSGAASSIRRSKA
jgi:hypothetical protein